jgi:putative component of toxin-antitoxin plasmid stabilization module
MLSVLEYLDGAGSSPFAKWFQTLDAVAAAKVTTAVRRLELGNFSNVKGVGARVSRTASISGRDIGSTSARTETLS